MAKTQKTQKTQTQKTQTLKGKAFKAREAALQLQSQPSKSMGKTHPAVAASKALQASKAPSKASKAETPKAEKPKGPTAKVVPLTPGMKGSVQHRGYFLGEDLIKELLAAGESGDSLILKAAQLDSINKAMMQAINKALQTLKAPKGLHWVCDNLQLVCPVRQ